MLQLRKSGRRRIRKTRERGKKRQKSGNGIGRARSEKILLQENAAFARRPHGRNNEIRKVKTWLKKHISNPYPSKDQINDFVLINDLTETQVKDWFANARRRWPVFKKYNRVKKINRSRMMF